MGYSTRYSEIIKLFGQLAPLTLMPSDFGAFSPVFETAHGYLALLNLSADDSADAVRLVRQCAATDVGRASVLTLLADLNWRPTLVAAVAAAFLPSDTGITEALWHRIDAGSWVVPQIAVVLAAIDPDFELHARQRLEAHCPLDSSELRALTMVERHSAAGPAGGTERSAKTVSVLQTLLSATDPRPEWLDALLASTEHQQLVASDIDSAGSIAQRWGERFAHIRQQIQP
jgi:hypothetical protein